ncbi:MAG: metallophosphoesterase [Deltaproteobacteria bacterium]|jgi:predicted MPP superfamily phosphohydrolase|nr:metallophosphoesterase [Deltaproteobacteria bacterium]
MFLAVMALLALSLVYTPWRMKKWMGLKRFWPWTAVGFAWTGGYLALIMSGAYTLDSRFFAVLFVALGLLFMFGVYAFFGTLLLEILKAAVKKLPAKAAARAVCVLSLALVAYGFANAQSFRVTRYEIEVPGLRKAVTLVHAPDLHLGPARGAGYLRKALAAIDGLKPDFVLYNGDLVDGNIALKPEVFDQFRNVDARQYFTTGNHEYYVDTDEVLDFVRNAGIRALLSERVEESGLNLIGMHYMNADLNTNQGHRVNDLGLDRELPKIARDPDLPDLLVHHSPVGLQYADGEGIEVYLAGHTHAGQVFPGTLLIRRNFPYFRGRYDIGGVKLLVSQGVGTFGPVMRLGTFSELQHITLKPAPGPVPAPGAPEAPDGTPGAGLIHDGPGQPGGGPHEAGGPPEGPGDGALPEAPPAGPGGTAPLALPAGPGGASADAPELAEPDPGPEAGASAADAFSGGPPEDGAEAPGADAFPVPDEGSAPAAD